MYRTGRNDYIKLLLNQEDPALFGRTLAYHDYYNRARIKRIEVISIAQEQLKALQEKIRNETGQLVSLRSDKDRQNWLNYPHIARTAAGCLPGRDSLSMIRTGSCRYC